MYMYMYMYMYVYVCIDVCIYIYIYCVGMYIKMNQNVCICMYKYMHVYMYMPMYIYICMIDHSEYHCFFQSQTCAKQEWQDHMSQLLSSAFPPSSTSPASWFRSRIGRFNGKTRGKPMWIIGKNPPKIGNIWNMDMKHGFKIRKNIGKPM